MNLHTFQVGFTPLSSRYSAEVVLGILSDIFEEFDSLAETHKVDKVKTIGDAYIVCAGALSESRGKADDAMRVVRMGLAMQDVVEHIAATKKVDGSEEKLDIAVRLGVHTGRCTGGIIGTVRFHFDMWGGAVVGAVKMEESGEKRRVHVSDKTQALLDERLFLFEVTLTLTLTAHLSPLTAHLSPLPLTSPPQPYTPTIHPHPLVLTPHPPPITLILALTLTHHPHSHPPRSI